MPDAPVAPTPITAREMEEYLQGKDLPHERVRAMVAQLMGESVRAIQVECHAGRDILPTLSEAMMVLPICPLLGVVSGAHQEIDALRGKLSQVSGLLREGLEPANRTRGKG